MNWPAGNPEVTKVHRSGEFIGIWTEKSQDGMTEKATFMVLQDFDAERGGELIGETMMPWFGRCRVFRLSDH